MTGWTRAPGLTSTMNEPMDGGITREALMLVHRTPRPAASRPMQTVVVDERDTTKDWFKLAACLGMDPSLFNPQRGESPEPAKQVCASCFVRSDCLAWALKHREAGVWGGTTVRQREHMLGKRLPGKSA